MTDDLRTRIAAVLNANLPVMEYLRPGDTEYAADAVIRDLARLPVHNHGVEEGAGLACRESFVGGQLIGQCMQNQETP